MRPWDKYKKGLIKNFSELDSLTYINDEGFEVPDNTIAVVSYVGSKCNYSSVIESLIGYPSRDWFIKYASFCLPLTIANQYGYVVKAEYDLDIFWDGESMRAEILNAPNPEDPNFIQGFSNEFGPGVVTISHKFVMRTPPGINLMTMQPPNHHNDGFYAMNGVVESDNLRRDFTFNLKITKPNTKISIKKGDWLSAFIPVPRFFVEGFEMKHAEKIFSQDILDNEIKNVNALGWQRNSSEEFGGDVGKINGSGRRYFKGIHASGKEFKNHQKRIQDGMKQ